MDVVTHGLASVAVARAFFPRAGKAAMASAVFAGTAADIDWLSHFLSPSVYFTWHRTFTHSLLASFFLPVAAAASLSALLLVTSVIAPGYLRGGGFATRLTSETGQHEDAVFQTQLLREAKRVFLPMYLASLFSALLHIAMDACQSEGVALFWPFSAKRIAADWLPSLDPWILVILVGAVALPELLHLVSSEIGAKSKKPRGQTGAIMGLLLLVAYIGARATLHSNAVATMQSRNFHGETPRRAAVFPETLSLLTWHGIAETERALNQVTVDVAGGGSFDPDTSLRVFKPEPSPELDAARKTEVATKFLAVARFPKATVEKTEKGYMVQLRDLRYAASGETQHEIAAIIRLDEASKVTSEELIWARDLHR